MRAFKLEGSSMKPIFREGGVALVKPKQQNEVKAGDCVVYKVGGKRLLHRVIGKEPDGLWISDDAGIIEPHFAQWELIEGKVLSSNPLKNGCAGLVYSRIRRLFSKAIRASF